MKFSLISHFAMILLASTVIAAEPVDSSHTTVENTPKVEDVKDVTPLVDPKIVAKRDALAKLLQAGSDPFRLSSSSTGGGAVAAMDLTKLALFVKMKGILKIKDREPMSLVDVGEDHPIQLVKKGDLIVLSQDIIDKRSTQIQTPNLYLIVKEIGESTVVVAPQQRPQEQMTIR